MYLQDTQEYQTIWQLAHNWAGKDSNASTPDNLDPEVVNFIHRIMAAIKGKLITARNTSGVILGDKDFLEFMLELPHYLKFKACTKKNCFDKNYLDSLYVWRPEVLRWCTNNFLSFPPIWEPLPAPGSSPETDADEKHWYAQLSDRRKGIIAALHIADRLWKDNPSLSYSEVWNHEDMKKYDKPRIFSSLESFKEWAKHFAPIEAKSRGRRKKSES